MIDFIIYLLKAILCSGIFMLYYRAAFYNRVSHEWNRFYLVGAVIFSLFIPLVHIVLPASQPSPAHEVVRLLQIVSSDKNDIDELASSSSTQITSAAIVWVLYVLLCAMMFFRFISVLIKLKNIYDRNPKQFLGGICLISTREKAAPFSFFRNIFWNNDIQIESRAGSRIFQHELTHVRQWHSADRLFMNCIMIVFWCNPFYWIIRRELAQVHEFIADGSSLNGDDLSDFSQMILVSTFPGHDFSMTSKFSSSSFKRRLAMLTKMQHPKVSYSGRLFFLPVLILVFAAFTLKIKPDNKLYQLNEAQKPFTVVIDAGHGGKDPGVRALDGSTEKDINLAIAQKILRLNHNPGIHILLTRDDDTYLPVKEKVNWSLQQHPDAFISIHVGAGSGEGDTKPTGFEIFTSSRSLTFEKQSQLLGSFLSGDLQQIYTVAPELKKRSEKGIWVLDAPTITYPALLITCGNISNNKDLDFIQNSANQDEVAKQILNALVSFANDKSRQISSGDQWFRTGSDKAFVMHYLNDSNQLDSIVGLYPTTESPKANFSPVTVKLAFDTSSCGDTISVRLLKRNRMHKWVNFKQSAAASFLTATDTRKLC